MGAFLRILEFISTLTLAVVLFGIAAYVLHVPVPAPLDHLFGPRQTIKEIRQRITPKLEASLTQSGLRLGSPVFMRVFKEEHVLELWVQQDRDFQLYKNYTICNYSGALGQKLREGDRQSPEGFYTVGKSALNPNSSFHLSFNLGFPNPYDRARKRTGSYLMVHGNCVSVGCYAMTDPAIEEIYVIAEAALDAGQPFFGVHAFPFRMTAERLGLESASPWYNFWQHMKIGYDLFEQSSVPPLVDVSQGRYAFGS